MPTTPSRSRRSPGSPRSRPCSASCVHVADAAGVEQPGELLADGLGPGDHLLVDDDGGEQRDDADHRADLDRDLGAVRRDQLVVVQAVGVVPHPEVLHRLAHGREVLEELEHEVGRRALARPVEDRRDAAHGQRVERHPAGGVGLLEPAADRQVRAVDRPDVVEAEEAALEQVRTVGVLAVDPPREVDEQLVEDLAQEVEVAAAVDGEDLQRRPRLHRRVDVAEVPLVRRQRAVRVLEPLPADQQQLVLGERRVEVGQGDAVERRGPTPRTTGTPTCRAST